MEIERQQEKHNKELKQKKEKHRHKLEQIQS